MRFVDSDYMANKENVQPYFGIVSNFDIGRRLARRNSDLDIEVLKFTN